MMRQALGLFLALAALAPPATARVPVRPFPDPHQTTRDALLRLESTSLHERLEAERELAGFGPELAPIVLDHARSGRFPLTAALLDHLVDAGGSPGRLFVHGVLRDERAEVVVRARAALALGRARYGPAVPDLAGLLARGSGRLRPACAHALGIIGDRRARQPLVAALDDDDTVMAEAALALHRLGDSQGLGLLAGRYRAGVTGRLAFEAIRNALVVAAGEWTRYRELPELPRQRQDVLLENWLYEWDRGTLPPLTARPRPPRRRATGDSSSR